MKGAIAGAGYFAGFHMYAWQRMRDVEITAVADIDPIRAEAFASQWRIPNVYADIREMLAVERPDFVDIATRPEAHLPLTALVAEAKAHVFCQKPMAPTWDECLEMVTIAKDSKLRLMIHENWRWQQWYREIHSMLQRGDVGQPVTYYFRTRRRDGIGPEPYPAQPYFRNYKRFLLYETVVHHIDTARFLFGDVERVYAQLRQVNPHIQGEDQVQLLMKHKGGLCGTIDGHRFVDLAENSGPLGDAFFEGDEGMLWLDPTGNVLHRDAAGKQRMAWQNTATAGYRGDSVRATQQHFIECLRSGAEFESDASEYLKTVAVVEAGYRSAETEAAVRL